MECDIFWDIQTKWFATFIWVPHLLTLTTTPNFLNLEISTQLTWEGETLPVPPVPSRTPAARWLAQAKYCENCCSHKEEEAEKSRIRIARYRASIKADPERYSKKREKRKEANAQKGTKQGYQVEEKKDYALEYALWTHRRQDELQQRVSDTLWRDKDGWQSFFFFEREINNFWWQEWQAEGFWVAQTARLAALDNHGIYTSWCITFLFPPWSNPERDTKKGQAPSASAKIFLGGAPPSSPPGRLASLWGMPAAMPGSMPTLRAPPSLRTWSLPGPPRPRPTAPLLHVRITRHGKSATWLQKVAKKFKKLRQRCMGDGLECYWLWNATSVALGMAVLSCKEGSARWQHACRSGGDMEAKLVGWWWEEKRAAKEQPLMNTYVVRGSGAIYTSLEDAQADFNIAAAWGQATLCATDNPWVATHVAADHTLEEARAFVSLGNLGGQTLVPPVPPVPPPMPPPEVEPETTEMNIDEPTGREDDEGSQDGWLLDNGSSDEDKGPDAEGEEISAVLEGVASLGVDRE
ncbi:hypothetical protein K438DRAFT_1765224 [Mycena galopus ATCC 62051]|nr:hypothetical protein K438DRAFT_1765224 [Mycena galopus ATCC 62051]